MTHRLHRLAIGPLIAGAALALGASAGVIAVHAGDEDPAQVRLEPAGSRVDYGDGAFTVRVELTALEHHGQFEYDDNQDTIPDRIVPSEGMAAYEVRFRFNPLIIDIVDAEPGTFIEESGRSVQCLQQAPEPGEFAFACVSLGTNPGVQGEGLLGTVTIMPVGDGTTLLGVEPGLSGPLGDPIPVEWEGGVVEVFGTPKDAPTPDLSDPDPRGDPVEPDGPGGPASPNEPGSPGEPGNDGPTVIGGGELGDVELPTGSDVPRSDTNGDTVIDSEDAIMDAANGEEQDEDFPGAGTGYDAIGWTGALAGALAAVGAVLLMLSLRFASAPRRE